MKELTQKIPLITAFLITAGFVNSYSFYSHFGIEIFTFQTSGELILSFLPVIVPLFIAIIFLLIFSFQKLDQFEKEKKENPFISDKDLTFWGPFRDLKKLIKNKFKSDDKIGETLYHYIVQILSRLIMLAIFLGPTYFYIHAFINKLGYPYNQPTSFLTISLIWIIIISIRVSNFFNKYNLELSRFMTPFIIFVGFLITLYLFNSFKAFRILENKPFYSIELIVNGTKIRSDDNLIYIGKTKDYYFMRDLKNEKNMIINNTNVNIVYFKAINKN